MAKAEQKYYALILAGGRGTRFWPRSRKRTPKQVLNVAGEHTLIQDTVARLSALIPPERIWILTNDHVRDEIVRQLPGVPQAQIIAEPAQRNTAPAIGLAAHILCSIDKDAVFGVFPADHVIGKPKRFISLLKPAFRAAVKGGIAILGIKPRWAETGYGYIEFPKRTQPAAATVPVSRFREKPDKPHARKFFKAGHYFWNAGMFFWRADTLLKELRQHLPRTATLLSSLPAFTDRDFASKLTEVYPRCENISIDYAVLERAKNVAGVPCPDFEWNDVGSWDAVYELLPRDANGNVSRAEILCSDSTGNYVDVGKKLVVLAGVDDLIVVDTPDALLITRRGMGQNVGLVVKALEDAGREDLL